jgi:hypothetical protein
MDDPTGAVLHGIPQHYQVPQCSTRRCCGKSHSIGWAGVGYRLPVNPHKPIELFGAILA